MIDTKQDNDDIKNSGEVIESEKDDVPSESWDNETEMAARPGSMAVNDGTNTHLRRLISNNYIEYASYVIKERAIPEINDGLKPVQRRILWSLHRVDDGKFHKVANLVGYAMQFHPHGDASIYQALVGLANKEYFIDKQGNFGNVFTGDEAAAARYIEARLTPLAREVLFNDDITEFVDSYDGRNKEPVFLPSKIPLLLMTGQEGIAPGMTTTILSHNFKELLEAQIAILNGQSFQLYPDFLHGGIMNAVDYNDGNGKITVRAKIDIDGRRLIIREIPAMTDTERLIASIEKAANKNKIKIASINDYTSYKIEIEVVPARGYNPEKTLKALYTYTECSMSVIASMLVIKNNRPQILSISDILRYNTECLVSYLKQELTIELGRLNEKFHEKSLERIFIDNRIYKKIEECETYELVHSEVRKGLNKFVKELQGEITEDDIEKLLAIPIRKISKYDLNKNKDEIEEIVSLIKEVEKNLKSIKKYTIKYIQSLIDRYAVNFPRRTEIEEFEEIDKKAIALNNIKVGWDRGNGYIGSGVKSDETFACNEFNCLICIEKSGKYKIIPIPQKTYIGKLFYFNKYDKTNVYSVIYKEKKSGKYFIKKCMVAKFIREKEYNLIPEDCQLELIITKENCVYDCVLEPTRRCKEATIEADFSKISLRNPGARGFLLTDKKVLKIVFKRQEEQSAALLEQQAPEGKEGSYDVIDLVNEEKNIPSEDIKTGKENKKRISEIKTKDDNIEEKHELFSVNKRAQKKHLKKSSENIKKIPEPVEVLNKSGKRKKAQVVVKKKAEKSIEPIPHKLSKEEQQKEENENSNKDLGVIQPNLRF